MKKSRKPTSKPKEFASRPFSPLRGVRSELGTGKPAPVAAPVPEAEEATEEMELFARAMADVRRIKAPRAAGTPPEPPLPTMKNIEEKERNVFLEALEGLQLDVQFVDALPEDVEELRPLAVNRMRQLKRGAIRIDLQLDLHGLTRDEALESLAPFIAGAYKRSQRAVLVITGKGNNSPDEPVLLGAVSGWLRDKGKGMVAEFAPAPQNLGGSGAFVVFLKEKAGIGDRRPETRG
jgi:DNA-nicking Smr family endonuclease